MPNQGSSKFTTTYIASFIAKSLARKGGFSNCMFKLQYFQIGLFSEICSIVGIN